MNNQLIAHIHARTHTQAKASGFITVYVFRLILHPVSPAYRKNENKTSQILLHFNGIQLTILADYSLLTNICFRVSNGSQRAGRQSEMEVVRRVMTVKGS